jgi:Dicarboxylate transport
LKLLRLITVFLFLIVLCLGGLYSQRITLTESLLRDKLDKIGWITTELVIDDISSDSVSVSSLLVSVPEGPLRNLACSNLVLHYELRELLKGSLNKLDIESLRLLIDPQKSSNSKQSSLPFATLRKFIPQDVSIENLSLTTPEFSQNIHIQLSAKNVIHNPFKLNIAIDAEKVTLQQWFIGNCKGNFSLTTEDGEKIVLDENSTFRFDSLSRQSTSITNSHISISALLERDPTTNNWQLPHSKMYVTTEAIQHQDISLKPLGVSLEIQAQTHPFQADVTLSGEQFTLQQNTKNITIQDLQATLLATDTDIDLKVQFTPAILPGPIKAHINHTLKENLGTAHFATVHPLNLQNSSDSFKDIFQNLDLPLQITGGIINADGRVDWKDKKLQQVLTSFTLRKGDGSYGKTLFKGLIIQQDLQLFPTITTRSSGYISASELQNGFLFKNFSLQNQIIARKDTKTPQLYIDSIQVELFGGIISSTNILLDPQQPDFESTIQLNRIDLREIIETSKVKGLNVNGVLDGTIRLHVNEKGVTIPSGELHSRTPGGTINYFPPGGAGNLSTLPAYALKALEEFNYNILTATPTYYEDGTLIIEIHTEGYSPQLKTKRPVHLNLNAEQNILSLLESLRYSNTLSDSLEQRLQDKPLENESQQD